ncbi:MAG TPA: SBBP repeat-containing protein [Terriglobia bacterium]|nr:SBBP repeat-containing protein [Terriglobia bacterium]
MSNHSAPRARRSARTVGLSLFFSALVAISVVWGGSWVRALGAHRRTRQIAASAAVPKPVESKVSEVSRKNAVYARLPLSFEANQGQADSRVKFLARGEGYALFLTSDEAVLALKKGTDRTGLRGSGSSQQTRPAVLRMSVMGANPDATVSGVDELPGKSNYFVGNDRARWRTGIANYARVRYQDVYPGIDLVYYGNQRQLEYDFTLDPGADSGAIGLAVGGAERASVSSLGDLVLDSDGGQVVLHRPVIYQARGSQRQEIAGGYELGRRLPGGIQEVRFRVGAYDHSRQLVIDPSLSYASYLGGTGNDYGNGIAIDSSGNAYLTGQTFSTNFPKLNAYQSTCSSCSISESNVFVTKVNASGTALVYSTYIGGNFGDAGNAIAVDSGGNAYVAGNTSSSNFPVVSAFQSTSGGPTFPGLAGDGFVLKLAASGSTLTYSSYIGGSLEDDAYGIAVDSAGEAFVVGRTASTNFPLLDAYQAQNNGGFDIFVAKVAAAGSSLVYSTYLGGASEDDGFGIAVGPGGGAYITGQTFSNDFPTASAYQTAYGGSADAFVAKLAFSSSKLSLTYSTYLGGTSSDQAFGIALDSSLNAYVTGSTSSTDFPTVSPIQSAFQGGSSDAFLSKLSSTGTALTYSTYLGGNSTDAGRAVAVDSSGHAHVAGYTSSSNFPTINPVQSTYGGNQDAFLSRVSPSGCGLVFSTFLGGKSTDGAGNGDSVAVNASTGDTYMVGTTGSNDFPTQKPFQAATGGNNDVFLAKVAGGTAPVACFSPANLAFGTETASTTSQAMTTTLTNDGDATLNITSVASSGPYEETNTCGTSLSAGANCTISVTFSPTAAGNAGGSVTITDNAGGVTSATQAIPLSGTGADFALSVTPPSVSVSPGQTATYTVTLTASSKFTDTVTLSCSGDPSPGGCSISPTSITPTGGSTNTAKLTATTVASSSVPPGGLGNLKPPFFWLITILGCGLLGVAAWARRMRRGRVLPSLVTAAGFLLLVAVWFGCGVSTTAPTHTLPGNYPITITGTDGSLTHSVNATLSVQ